MIVTLYNGFFKRDNSTLLPEVGAGLQFDNVVLKEPADLLTPVIRFSASGQLAATGAAPVLYTYAHIPKFTRYYFIDNWTYTGGCWEASLRVDVLASWKSIIGAASLFIERAESAYDGNIVDMMFPATNNFTIINTGIRAPGGGITIRNGCFVVGIISGSGTAGRIGAITYYAMTVDQLAALMGYLFSNNIWQASNITEIGEGLYKSLFNPFQYIVSCMWFPITISAIGTQSTTIKVGYWDTGLSAYSMAIYVTDVLTEAAALPNHPQAAARGNYLNFAPYAEYMLYLPPFGTIPLDASFRSRGNYVHYDCHIDILTGESTLRVGFRTETGNVAYCTERTAMLGVPIQLAQILSDYSHSLQTLASPSPSLIGVATTAATALCLSAIESVAPKVSTSGATGALVNFTMAGVIVSKFANITSASDTILGRPLLAQRTISSLSGFIKCRDAHISAPCLAAERGMIEAALNGGFYYE